MDSEQLKKEVEEKLRLLQLFENSIFKGLATPMNESLILFYLLTYHTKCCACICKTLGIPFTYHLNSEDNEQ